jgi:hypothetical protein
LGVSLCNRHGAERGSSGKENRETRRELSNVLFGTECGRWLVADFLVNII